MTDALSLSRFSEHIGEAFVLPDADPTIQFTLIEAEPLRSTVRDIDPERSFSLVFAAPDERPIGQQTVTLQHDELGSIALFVVPIAERDGSRHYEAVINRD